MGSSCIFYCVLAQQHLMLVHIIIVCVERYHSTECVATLELLLLSPALSVVIDISYTPPEEGYQPPYYRAASAVTLTCRVLGATGRIRFLWSSTCSSCFVPGGYYYSYSSHSRSESFLLSHDAGTHTCTAYDSSQRISGSASTMMNIVGEWVKWHTCTIQAHSQNFQKGTYT